MRRITHSIIVIIAAMATVSCSGGKGQENIIITTMDDLEGRVVSALGGSVQDLLISSNGPACEILRSERDDDALMMVETGKACAMLESDIIWSIKKDSYPHVVAVGERINPIPIGFAFGKDKDDLRERFNIFLAGFLARNDIEQIRQDWADADSGRVMPQPSEVGGENGTLRFAVSAMTQPFEFIRNGEVVGLEAEILARFAISENMKWEFTDVVFSGLIPYIQSGKADAGCSIISITPERSQSIDFSDPWTFESSILLVNRKYAPAGLAGEVEDDGKSFFQSVKESFYKNLIKEDRYKMILQGLDTTILISVLAALFGTLLGILLCYASMRRNKFVSGAANVFIEFMRCMPQVVFLMIMFYLVFGRTDISGLWVAVIAFTLCFGAYTSVIFRTSVQSIDKGQNEAALSMGFGKLKAFTNIILPQTVQRALPVYKGEFIGLVKATSIVGYIAVFDLTKAGDIIRSRTYEAFFPLIMVTIIYFLVIWLLTIVLRFAESKTQPKRKKFFK